MQITYKSSLAMPAFAGNHFQDPVPAELDYDCYVTFEDDGNRLVIISAYVPDLDLKLAPHQLTHRDKQVLIRNAKFH